MKARVLHLVQGLHQGGTELQAIHLAGSLRASRRYTVYLACLDPGGSLRPEVEGLFGTVPSFPLRRFGDTATLRQLRRFVTLLRSLKIDVVHAHDFYSNIFGIAGATLARVPARIASRRELVLRSAVRRRVERLAFRGAHVVLANSQAVRRQLLREGVCDRSIAVIHNGIDLDRVAIPPSMTREAMLALLGLSHLTAYRFVTIVANLRPCKDHATFLYAARQVAAAAPDAAFLIAGEGDLEPELRALAQRLKIDSRVYFLGRCDRIAPLLALSQVCVLSSATEGFANAILEYMAAGRPVVATDVGGASEAVKEDQSGYLVPPGDAEGMASRIVFLLEHPDRARALGAQGKQIAASRFSRTLQVARTEDLYDQLLSRTSMPDSPSTAPSGHA